MDDVVSFFRILGVIGLGGGSVAPAWGQKLAIKGSETLGAKLVPILAEEF